MRLQIIFDSLTDQCSALAWAFSSFKCGFSRISLGKEFSYRDTFNLTFPPLVALVPHSPTLLWCILWSPQRIRAPRHGEILFSEQSCSDYTWNLVTKSLPCPLHCGGGRGCLCTPLSLLPGPSQTINPLQLKTVQFVHWCLHSRRRATPLPVPNISVWQRGELNLSFQYCCHLLIKRWKRNIKDISEGSQNNYFVLFLTIGLMTPLHDSLIFLFVTALISC